MASDSIEGLLVPAGEVLDSIRETRQECARVAVAVAYGFAADHHKLCCDCERTCQELAAEIEAAILNGEH